MKMPRMITTSMNLFKYYGVRGFIKGVLNKLNGRSLLYGVQLKNRDNAGLQIGRKLTTASNLLRQFGVKGFLKGIANKLRGKSLLEGIYFAPSGEMEVSADPQVTSRRITAPSLFTVSQYLLKEPYHDAETTEHSCTIVIPVYNGLQHLKRLLPSVEENTPDYINVLLVNDGSPDKQIVPFLESFVNKHDNWKLMENPKNYGFVKTVNRGMAVVKTDYAILLNTDTVVPENWIPKMLTPFYENEKVASTTPFTNAGVYFSFPNFGYDNEPKWDIEKLNEAFSYVASDEYALNEIPSGTGFCMGVNMACWRKIGGLDYKNFGKGYGEENDWCFRAKREGWRHLLVPNLFVHHYHGGSFLSEEKQKLCDEHQKILQKKYPECIFNEIPAFFKRDPWKVYRFAAALKLSTPNTILYINLKTELTDVSGAVDYANKELKELSDENNSIIIAHYVRGTKQWAVVPYSVDPTMEIPLDDVADLQLLFNIVDIKKIIINNLAFCENAEKAAVLLARLRAEHDVEMVYKFHDYLSVCPSFFLINRDILPCDPSTTLCSSDYCKDCIRQSRTKAVQRNYLAGWRRAFSELFDQVDTCYFFSHYSKDIVCKIYPQLIQKAVVKYHEPLFTGNESKYIRPKYTDHWNIAFVGNFCMEKGSKYFIALRDRFRQMNIKSRFVIVGENNSGQKLGDIDVLGKYSREELGQILTANKVHTVVYPSLNNETFSYVAQELMMLNVPLVVFKCGAPQERIRDSGYQFARIAEEVSVESLYEATEQLLEAVYKQKLQ